MNDLFSGFLGALIGVSISSFVSMLLFQKQMRFESNRHFLEELIDALQKIYIAQLSRLGIPDESIDIINAFQVIMYKEFESLENDLEILKKEIINYRNGQLKSREQSTQSTTGSKATDLIISMEEVQARKAVETSIKNIMRKIRKVT